MTTEQAPAIKIGQILKSLRKKHNLSQLEVALRCDISPRHYQEIEYGNKNCQINTLTKILKIFDVSIFSFFTSFFTDEFQKNGVAPLYDIFGHKAFGYRSFDLDGTVTFQCEYSRMITGMSDEEVVGKMKLWSDLTDPGMITFVKTGLKYLINYLPTPPSWKVYIKNHKTQKSHPFMGYCRYTRGAKNKVIGIEVIIFPLGSGDSINQDLPSFKD